MTINEVQIHISGTQVKFNISGGTFTGISPTEAQYNKKINVASILIKDKMIAKNPVAGILFVARF